MLRLSFRQKTIVALSDTHGRHRLLNLPEADILLHLGDACTDGNEEQLSDFFEWFEQQSAKHKVFVAGNHDLPFDLEPKQARALVPAGVWYLAQEALWLEGIRFQALEARPWLHQQPEIKLRPDFLLSHGPPKGVLDAGRGCPLLLQVTQSLQPVFHLFGHIHENAGEQSFCGFTQTYNVCPPEIFR